jgi:hypothetical protein
LKNKNNAVSGCTNLGGVTCSPWAGDWDYELGGKSLAESNVNSGFLLLENCVTEVTVSLNEQD